MNKETESNILVSNNQSVLEHVLQTDYQEENSVQDFTSFKEEILKRCSELHVGSTMEELFKEYLQELKTI